MWTRFSMDSANTAASNQPRPPPVTAERIADAFESYARKLAEAGIPLDRIAEGLSMAAVRAEVAHREDLMHKLRDTVAAWVSPLNAASGPRHMRTVAGLDLRGRAGGRPRLVGPRHFMRLTVSL